MLSSLGPNTESLQTPTSPSNNHTYFNILSISYISIHTYQYLTTEKHSKQNKQLFILSSVHPRPQETLSDSVSVVYFNADLRKIFFEKVETGHLGSTTKINLINLQIYIYIYISLYIYIRYIHFTLDFIHSYFK